MAIGRRGVLFTIMAILVVAMILTTNSVLRGETTHTEAQTESSVSRVTVMNNYLETFDDQARAGLRTAGFFALKNISRKVFQEQSYITPGNFNTTFWHCVNRTVGSDESGMILINAVYRENCIAYNQSISFALSNLSNLAKDNLIIETKWELHNAWVTESRPYELTLWLNYSYEVKDYRTVGVTEADLFANWRVQGQIVNATIRLEGVPDPIYEKMRSDGITTEQRNFSESIRKRHNIDWTFFDEWTDNKTYITVENQAPSILQRYYGEIGNVSQCCGIESVMNVSKLSLPGAPYEFNYSMIDHHYAAHHEGILGEWSCQNDTLRAYTNPGWTNTMLLYWHNFVNLYNLSQDNPNAPYACP